VLSVGLILVDHRKNFARGGGVDGPDHPDVKQLVDSLRESGRQLEPVGVRKLDAPIARPPEVVLPGSTLTHFHYELVYGYRRMTSIGIVGWPSVSCVNLGTITDIEARRLNLIENFIRKDPTDYDNAVMFATICREETLTPQELARQLGAKPVLIEQLVRIVERCPKEILEQWRLSPMPDYRRALDRISKIEEPTPLDTKRRMLDEWSRFLSERESSDATSKDNPFRFPRAARALGRKEIEALRARVDVSHEVQDATGWRPLSDFERATIDAVLRYVADPRKNKMPLR
jgi:ParB-like chromosome segregation protein Spo0J